MIIGIMEASGAMHSGMNAGQCIEVNANGNAPPHSEMIPQDIIPNQSKSETFCLNR
jgi:hypothetical protein